MYSFIGLKKSTPPQNRQLIVYHYSSEYEFGCFCGRVDSQKLIDKYIASNEAIDGQGWRRERSPPDDEMTLSLERKRHSPDGGADMAAALPAGNKSLFEKKRC